jgi:hypothetical protein
MTKPKLKLVGTDGNGFAILAKAKQALRKAGASQEHIDKYLKETMSGYYDNLLTVTMEYFEVE